MEHKNKLSMYLLLLEKNIADIRYEQGLALDEKRDIYWKNIANSINSIETVSNRLCDYLEEIRGY